MGQAFASGRMTVLARRAVTAGDDDFLFGGWLGLELEIAENDFLVGGGSRAEAPEVHGERKRDLGDARSVIGRRKGDGLKNVGGGA